MQVLWLGRDVAGEDTTGAMGGIQMVQIEGLAVWGRYGVRACRWVEEYFHPAWVEYKYVKGVYLGGDYEGKV